MPSYLMQIIQQPRILIQNLLLQIRHERVRRFQERVSRRSAGIGIASRSRAGPDVQVIVLGHSCAFLLFFSRSRLLRFVCLFGDKLVW